MNEDFGNEIINFDDDFDREGMEIPVIQMTDDDGNENEYVLIDEFTHEGVEYMVVVDAEEAEEEETDALIFKKVLDEEDDVVYEELGEDEYEGILEIIKQRLGGDFEITY